MPGKPTISDLPYPVVPAGGDDLARMAFAAAAAMDAAQSLEALDQIMRPVAEALGYSDFMMAQECDGKLSIVAGAPSNAFFRDVSPQFLGPDDPVRKRAQRTPDAFFYSDIARRQPLNADETAAMAQRAAYGILDGFVGARHRQDGVQTSVVLVGARVDASDPAVRYATHIIAEVYSIAARRLLAEAPAPVLTQRQRDCLHWVGQGKSGADIAKILGLSPHTVHAYVAEACARLGVRTRVQAVAKALALGLIDP